MLRNLSAHCLLSMLMVLCLFMVPSFGLQAQVLPLAPNSYEQDTYQYTSLWIDETDTLTYTQATQKLKNGQFRPLSRIAMPGMFERGAYVYWIALTVRNSSQATFPLLLHSVRLSEDSTWHFRHGRSPTIKKLSKYGEKDPYGIIPYTLRWSWIYPIEPLATDTILIKYYNYKPKLNFLPTASDARMYAGRSLTETIQKHWYFIFGCGALFSIFVFAFSTWLYIREVSFFWYATFCLSLFITSLWNFDVEIPPLYFLSRYVEWTYTKLYLHTLFPAVCHSLFLYYFFRNQSEFLNKSVRWFLWACAVTAVIETAFLTLDQLHWSWVFYWWFRNFIVVFGLLILFLIRKIPGNQSKWIISGAVAIYVFEILSNFLPQYSTQITLMGFVADVFCFTVATASRFNQIQAEKYELLLAQKTRDIEQKLEMEQLRINVSQTIRNEIASDLHDDIGTTLSSISFLGEMAFRQLLKQEQQVGPILERIISQSKEMTQTMRGALWVINPQNDNLLDFCEKIRVFSDAVLRSRQINLSFQIVDPTFDCTLSLDIQRNLFLISKEVVVNISRHSGATEASIRIHATSFLIDVRITDNGQGFDSSQPSDGNGLRNIAYRVNQLGGQLTVCSKPEEGTSITLSVPTHTQTT